MLKAEPFAKEIGSEFWDIPLSDKPNELFSKHTRWYLSGRVALRAILSDRKDIRTAAVPDWCCESMLRPFLEAGISLVFYPAMEQYRGVPSVPACDVLLAMDYFGYAAPNPPKHPNIIRDLSHSLFSAPRYDTALFFGSLRKWCGVLTGGFAQADRPLPDPTKQENSYLSLRRAAMLQKRSYLKGERADKEYLRLFREAEAVLDRSCGISAADPEDIRGARHLDAARIRSVRRENAAVLMDAFRDWLVFPVLEEADCPMFVPILVPDGKRDMLRQFLIQQDIFCPVHWPLTSLHSVSGESLRLYENSLSLICDQRYHKEDMERLVDTVRAFWKG